MKKKNVNEWESEKDSERVRHSQGERVWEWAIEKYCNWQVESDCKKVFGDKMEWVTINDRERLNEIKTDLVRRTEWEWLHETAWKR